LWRNFLQLGDFFQKVKENRQILLFLGIFANFQNWKKIKLATSEWYTRHTSVHLRIILVRANAQVKVKWVAQLSHRVSFHMEKTNNNNYFKNEFVFLFFNYINFHHLLWYCDMSCEIIQSGTYDNLNDFQHVNFIFSQNFISLFWE